MHRRETRKDEDRNWTDVVTSQGMPRLVTTEVKKLILIPFTIVCYRQLLTDTNMKYIYIYISLFLLNKGNIFKNTISGLYRTK